ncbi:MAG: hypothetical protein ACKOQY_03340, partial [Bacteroidota bacterium]
MRSLLFLLLTAGLLLQSCDSVPPRDLSETTVVPNEVQVFNQQLDSTRIKKWMGSDSFLSKDTGLVFRVYRERNWIAAWTTPQAWTERAFAVVSALESIGVEGVRDSFPFLGDLRRRLSA